LDHLILNDWITIRRDTYDGPVEVVGTTPVYLTPTSANQTYHFHINTNDLCGIESACRDAQMTRQSALPVTMIYMEKILSRTRKHDRMVNSIRTKQFIL
jgi:hypothetical protein